MFPLGMNLLVFVLVPYISTKWSAEFYICNEFNFLVAALEPI